jgi:hypothetical protein
MDNLNKIAQKLLIKGHNDIFNRLLKLSFEHDRRERSKKSKGNLIAFWTALNNVVNYGTEPDTIKHAIEKIKEIEPTVRKYAPELFQEKIITDPIEVEEPVRIPKKKRNKKRNKGDNKQPSLFD